MTLTFASDLDEMKMTQQAKYAGQRSFSLKVHIETH